MAPLDLRTGSGRRLRFVPPFGDGLDYEMRIWSVAKWLRDRTTGTTFSMLWCGVPFRWPRPPSTHAMPPR
jgi:hypothetical protein